jgi:hypothetical protein
LVVQARGLAAEEYRYAHMQKKRKLWKHFYERWIYRALQEIEHAAYKCRKQKHRFHNIMIEAVSPALKHYLTKHFNAADEKITLATRDIPKIIEKSIIAQWRNDIREKLGIAHDAQVYCYSGSYKPWQCADQAIEHFIQIRKHDQSAYLLILSQDADIFEKILSKSDISDACFTIISVPVQEILRYVAAANHGYLFRDPDIINWVSRPTKMLEYQAVGLNIIHNNTIAWLVE